MRKLSFQDLLKEFTKERLTPRQQFIVELRKATGASVDAAISWIYGKNIPRNDAIEKIALHFDVDPECLFPPKVRAKNKSNYKKT